MRLTTRQSGVISYAGLDKDALWAAAKRAFAQTDEPVPERYASFLPIFPIELVQNMSYVGSHGDNSSPVSPKGFSIDPAEYHLKLWEEQPELYQDDNYRRNFNYEGRFIGRGAITVDRIWATRFPQYQPFMGERLHIYMIGGGHQAVAVPESIYPRGGELLRNVETVMRVTARSEHYTSYLLRRLAAGDKYDTAVFESDYLRVNELLPVAVTQAELGRVMQDLCIIRGLKGERPASRLFTENAKRAEGITQYAPFRCACDTFVEEPVTRTTARLLQLYYEEEDVSDLWLPYQDACEYIDRRRMVIDVAALCRGFQLAPEHDPVTRGGRYPTHVRVVVVRDRELRPLVADTINNPAYGSGMSPLGMINRLVYLPDSRELLRQGKLCAEEAGFVCENAEASAEEYRAMVLASTLQELKGRLIDALYRRESALSQMQEGSKPHERAKELLDKRVETLKRNMTALSAGSRRGQLSGYDADIDYLTRMAMSREGVPREGTDEPAPFVPDSLREQSIESGYAMRNSARYVGISAVAPEDEGEDDAAEAVERAAAVDTALPDEAVKAADASVVEAAADTADAVEAVTSVEAEVVRIEADDAVGASELDAAEAAMPDEAAKAADALVVEATDAVEAVAVRVEAVDASAVEADDAVEADVVEAAAALADAAAERSTAATHPTPKPTTAPKANKSPANNAPTAGPEQFEQLRMFGMGKIAPRREQAPDGANRPAMAGMARNGGANDNRRSVNPDGSMARMVKKKKKR